MRGGCWISGCCLVSRWLRAGDEAELRPRISPEPAAVRGRLGVGCVCGEFVLKSTPGAGDGSPGMRQRRCPRFLRGLCFTVSLRPLSLPLPEPPLAVLGEPAGPGGEGAGIGHRDWRGAPELGPCSGRDRRCRQPRGARRDARGHRGLAKAGRSRAGAERF